MENYETNINSLWAYLIIEELVRNGINCFCISPGSRSTPLTVAAANNDKSEKMIFFDERAAAFHALGYARATGKPAALICTSGTAAANYFPALIEASQDSQPMIVLSADRPPELQQTGANQTINQENIFGNYVRWRFNLPCPDDKIPYQMVLTAVDQAIHRSIHSPSGPVHINCQFREPLEPSEEVYSDSYLRSIADWKKTELPHTSHKKTHSMPKKEDIDLISESINSSKRGILVAGRLQSEDDIKSVSNLSGKLGWPIFGDVTSKLHYLNKQPNFINYFDQLLLSDRVKKLLDAEVILHIGGQLTSKRYLDFTRNIKTCEYIVVKDHPFRHDPEHLVTHRFNCDISEFCRLLNPQISIKVDQKWISKINKFDSQVDQLLEKSVVMDSNISEISAARFVSKNIPQNSGLFLASSMPIRDMDMYADFKSLPLSIEANRGASGIDGTIACATGFAKGLKKPVTVIIGDLALLHDLNSLSILSSIDEQLIIIAINNNGGGIFSFLPISKFPKVFETYFETPHTFNFENAAKMFQVEYYNPKKNSEFIEIYKKCFSSRKSALIEINTNRKENYNQHLEIQKSILSILEKQSN